MESGKECPGPITGPFFQDMTEEISTGGSFRRRIQKTVKSVRAGTTITTEKRYTVVNKPANSETSYNGSAGKLVTVVPKNPNRKSLESDAASSFLSAEANKLAMNSDSASHMHDYRTQISTPSPDSSLSPNRRALPIPLFSSPKDRAATVSTDPFGTLAIQLNQKNELLIHHCKFLSLLLGAIKFP